MNSTKTEKRGRPAVDQHLQKTVQIKINTSPASVEKYGKQTITNAAREAIKAFDV